MITIKDKKVIDFFQRNPDVKPNVLFSVMIDLYEYILKVVNHNNDSLILPYIIEQTNTIQTLLNKIDMIKEHSENSFLKIQKELEKNVIEIKSSINTIDNKIIDVTQKHMNDYLYEIKEILKKYD